VSVNPNGPNPVVPNWYPDPRGTGLLRWWDGDKWSPHTSSFPPPPGPPGAEHHDLVWVLPIGRTPLAIAAGYAGLFALLIVPAPIALGLGVAALRDIKSKPGALGRGRAWFATVIGMVGTAALIPAASMVL
jgi:hypothetical protein